MAAGRPRRPIAKHDAAAVGRSPHAEDAAAIPLARRTDAGRAGAVAAEEAPRGNWDALDAAAARGRSLAGGGGGWGWGGGLWEGAVARESSEGGARPTKGALDFWFTSCEPCPQPDPVPLRHSPFFGQTGPKWSHCHHARSMRAAALCAIFATRARRTSPCAANRKAVGHA